LTFEEFKGDEAGLKVIQQNVEDEAVGFVGGQGQLDRKAGVHGPRGGGQLERRAGTAAEHDRVGCDGVRASVEGDSSLGDDEPSVLTNKVDEIQMDPISAISHLQPVLYESKKVTK